MSRRIIDTHIHFWDLHGLPYPWLDDVEPELRSDYLPTDFALDSDSIELAGTVHVQAEVDHAIDPSLETAWLDGLAREHGTPSAIIGYADLRSPDLGLVLDRHQRSELFRGIRQEAWFDPRSTRADVPRTNLLDDPTWVSGLRDLRDRDLVFDLLIWQSQLAQAARIFADLPELRVVLEHTALPLGDRDQWRRDVAEFARLVPRATLKVSGLAFVDPEWTPSIVDPIIREAIHLFGPERCVLASNYPVDKPGISYSGIWQTFERCTDDLSAAEQDALFSRTAGILYGID